MEKPRGRGTRRALAVLGTLGALLAAGAVSRVAGEQPAAPAHGIVIYRDPATGRLGAPPPGFMTTPAAPPANLVERRGVTRGGGVLVDLQGRFSKTMTATRDAAGNVRVDCAHDGAGSEE